MKLTNCGLVPGAHCTVFHAPPASLVSVLLSSMLSVLRLGMPMMLVNPRPAANIFGSRPQRSALVIVS